MFLVLSIFLVIIGFLVLAFMNPVVESYEIKQAGYAYSPDGKTIKFSKVAKYNNEWIDNEKALEDNSKKKVIDLSRTLFLENDMIQFLGKSVAIISNTQLDELPSFTRIKEESTGYLAKAKDDKTISQLPKGTVVKLAEGRYIILDAMNLQNSTGLNQKMSNNSLIIIDENNKVRIDGDGKTEEMVGDDLFITMANSSYRFDLGSEQLINVSDKADTIDVKSIKVEIDDKASKRTFKSLSSTSEESHSESQLPSSSEKSNEEKSSAAKKANSSADNENSQQKSENQNNTNNVDVKNQNGNTNAATNSVNTNGNAGGNSNSNNSMNSNSSTVSDSKGSASNSSHDNSLNDQQIEEINDVVNRLNELDKKTSFQVPIVDVNAATEKKTISGDLTISDHSDRLEQLKVSLLLNGQVVQQQDIPLPEVNHTFSFSNLEYGNIYQLLVEGRYKYNETDSQTVTFYRKNYQLSPVKINKKVIDQTADSLTIQLAASDKESRIDELVLKYKVNNSQITDYQEISVDVSDLNGPERTTITELMGLDSNQEYLIEMSKLIVDGQDATDTSWYLIGHTKKQKPALESLLLEYSVSNTQFRVTPKNITDPDETITNIRYSVYLESDYQVNGSQAKVFASATVNATNKNSTVRIGRTSNMANDSYVVVAYVMGNDGQNNYELPPVVSNPVTIGQKVPPTIQFKLNEAKQDSLNVSYELLDQDETLIFNALSKPVFNVYPTDASGKLLSNTPIKTIEVSKKDELSGQLFIDGLTAESYYVVNLMASYSLADEADIMANQEIGRSAVFKTGAVTALAAVFTQTESQETEVKVNVKLDEKAELLTSGVLEIKHGKSGSVVQTIAVTQEMLKEMIDEEGLELSISELEHNTDYRISFVEAQDTGGNNVAVSGLGTLKTRKIAPETNQVLLNYDLKKDQLGAVVATAGSDKIVDSDQSISSIKFQLFDASVLKEDENTEPLAEKEIVGNFDSYSYFDLSDKNLGRGKTYVARAVVYWNDRYDNHEISLESEELAINKKLPKVEFQIMKRDASGITLKPFITDEDNILKNDEIILTNGTERITAKNEQEIVLPVSEGTLIQAIGEYQPLAGGATETAVLQQKNILGLAGNVSEVTNRLDVDTDEKLLSANVSISMNNAEILATKQSVYHDETKTATSIMTGNNALKTQQFPLPNNEADIWFNQDYNVSLDTIVYYAENKMDNIAFAGQYNIAIDDGAKFAASSNGGLTTTGSRINASLYKIEGATVDAKGNIDNVSFKNVLTNKYIAVAEDGLVDNAAQAATFTMKREPNGSYVLMTGSSYINFNSGLVSNKDQASLTDLYSANSTQLTTEKNIALPKLAVPEAVIDQLSVYDKRIIIKNSVSDTDNVILKDDQDKPRLFINIYKADSAELVKSVPVESLASDQMSIDGLTPDTGYTVRIEASYDVLEGSGEETAVLAEKNFTTISAAPEITKTTYSWSPSVYSANGRKIVNKTTFVDESKILDTIEYRLYELTSDIQYTTNVEDMTSVLDSKTPVTVYNSNTASNIFNMYDENGAQRFVAGKTYIVAAYVKTTKPTEIPSFLGNVNKVTITAPSTPTIQLKTENLTSTQVDLKFSYNDQHGYILSGNTKNFNYLLTETKTGNPVTYVDGYQGSFIGSNASTWLKNFQGLNPSTGYTLSITATFDDLKGGGARNWEKKVNFTTDDEYVTSNPLIYIMNGTSLNLRVANLNNGSATITRSRLVLYAYDAQTNTMGAELTSKPITPAESYPVDINETFDIQSLMGTHEFVMARLEVNYDTDLGETNQSYTTQNIIYIGSEMESLINPMTASLVEDGVSVQMEPEKGAEAKSYLLKILNERDQVIAVKEVEKEQLAETVVIPTGGQAVKQIEVLDEEQSLVASYQSNLFEQSVMAYYSEDQVMLRSSEVDSNQTYVIEVKPKQASLADQLFEAVSNKVVFKTETSTAIALDDTLPKDKKEKSFEISGSELKAGYTLSYSVNQYDISIREVGSDNKLILQKMEVLE